MKKVFVGLVAAAAIIAACSSDNTTSTPPVVASVTMVPALDSVQIADSQLVSVKVAGKQVVVQRTAQYYAILKDASGKVLSVIQTGQTVAWTTSTPSVATVQQSGIVKSVAPGLTTVTAAIQGQSATSNVKVLDTTLFVTAVHVSPATDSVLVDSTVSLKAWPLDAAGDTVTAAFTIWTSSDTSVAIVTNADTAQATLGVAPGNTAVIQGVKAGTVTITAKVAGVSGTGSMKVKP